MTDRVLLFFELHQPLRLRKLSSFTPPNLPARLDDLFDREADARILERVVERTYRKATSLLLEAAGEVPGFRFSMSLSGTLLKALKDLHPDVISLMASAVSREVMEPVAQTYYHSLASLIDEREFLDQVRAQADLVEDLLGFRPRVAENTEFIYNNDIGCLLHGEGFSAVFTEGVDWLLGWRSPNYVYQNPVCGVRVLLRNYRLSDDIGFRFSDRSWDQYPLTADKYAEWIRATPGDLVVIAIDFETFGEHHRPETGIYEFLRWLPREISRRGIEFLTGSMAASLTPRGVYDVPPSSTISWADSRDLGAWLGNQMQRLSFDVLRRYYYFARALGGDVLERWRSLSISDHYYYMATRWGPEAAVHSYFSHLGSPYEAFLTYSYALYLLGLEIKRSLERDPCALGRVSLPHDLCFHAPGVGDLCSLADLSRLLDSASLDKGLLDNLEIWTSDVFGLPLSRALEIARTCNARS